MNFGARQPTKVTDGRDFTYFPRTRKRSAIL
jgi:hypothetical protein